MDITLIAEELRGPLQKLPKMPLGNRWGRALIRIALRLLPTTKIAGVRIEQRNDLKPPLRIYYPDIRKSDGALFWIHGGGYVIGTPVLDDRLCGTTARALGIVVVSVKYRLAPEHPFPAPLDDCHAGWQWLQQAAATLGVDPRRIAIGGQSAGGGLAAALTQRIHDAAGNNAAAQWLFCPMLDDRTAARRELDAIANRVWNNGDNAMGWRAYLTQEPGAAKLPDYAVPARREHLHGLPPAWIGVGTIDLFHDEDRGYAMRLKSAGVDTRLTTVAAAPHGFEAWAFDSSLAQGLIADAQQWLARVLAQEPANKSAQ